MMYKGSSKHYQLRPEDFRTQEPPKVSDIKIIKESEEPINKNKKISLWKRFFKGVKMSTLDCAGNSNGEVPTCCWSLTKKYPRQSDENHFEWIQRLMALHKSGIK